MKIKTSELTGHALDWAVAKCEGMTIEIQPAGACGRPLYVLASEPGRTPWTWLPSESWHQGGPIIERERVAVWYHSEYGCWCSAGIEWMDADVESDAFFEMPDAFRGPTPLIAAMRCYVASKLGDEVEVPDELGESNEDK